MIQFRLAEPGDLARISIFDALPGERITEIIERRMIVCEVDGIARWYLSWQPAALAGNDYINKLVVDPSYRRRGIATALSRHVATILLGKVFISGAEHNAAALSMLKATGWNQVGSIHDLHPNGEAELFFCRYTAREDH